MPAPNNALAGNEAVTAIQGTFNQCCNALVSSWDAGRSRARMPATSFGLGDGKAVTAIQGTSCQSCNALASSWDTDQSRARMSAPKTNELEALGMPRTTSVS